MAEQGPQSPQAAASQRGTGHEGRRHLRHRSSLSGHGRPWPRGDTVTLRNLGHGEVLSRVTCHAADLCRCPWPQEALHCTDQGDQAVTTQSRSWRRWHYIDIILHTYPLEFL